VREALFSTTPNHIQSLTRKLWKQISFQRVIDENDGQVFQRSHRRGEQIKAMMGRDQRDERKAHGFD
jgi:hypothetical protein